MGYMEKPEKLMNFEKYVLDHGSKYDFVAQCKSPWQLLGIYAFIHYLMSSNDKIQGCIFICKYSDAGYVIDKTNMQFPQNVHIDIFYNDDVPLSFCGKTRRLSTILFCKNISSNSKLLYVLRQREPYLELCLEVVNRKGFRSIPVCIDEGLATYLHGFQNGASMSFLSLAREKILYNKFKDDIINFNLFVKSEGQIMRNNEAVLYYKRAIEFLNAYRDIPEISSENYIVIITQPIEDNDDKIIIDKTYEGIIHYCHEVGLKVYVKPHPRESANNISVFLDNECHVIWSKYTIEEILMSQINYPKAIVGLYSSSLIYVPALSGIKAFTIISLVYSRLSNKLKNRIDPVQNVFGKLLNHLNNYDELV